MLNISLRDFNLCTLKDVCSAFAESEIFTNLKDSMRMNVETSKFQSFNTLVDKSVDQSINKSVIFIVVVDKCLYILTL